MASTRTDAHLTACVFLRFGLHICSSTVNYVHVFFCGFAPVLFLPSRCCSPTVSHASTLITGSWFVLGLFRARLPVSLLISA